MYNVLGFKRVDYVNKKGNNILGFILYLTSIDEDVQGMKCTEIYINDSVDYQPQLNDVIEVYYNEYRKPSKIIVLT